MPTRLPLLSVAIVTSLTATACSPNDDDVETASTEVIAEAADIKELRAAIVHANGNGEDDIIILTGSDYRIADEGCSQSDDAIGLVGDLDVFEAGHSVRILGAPGVTISSECPDQRVFDVYGGAELLLERVTVTKAGGPTLEQGGLIRSGSRLTLDNVTLSHGKAERGGAVYLGPNAELRMTGSGAYYNTGHFDGGAFYLQAGLHHMTNSSIRENTASRIGGAVYLRTGKLHADGSLFAMNRVGTAASAVGAGGALALIYAEFLCAKCKFEANRADASISARGGAIYGEFATVTLDATRAIENVATTPEEEASQPTFGGAIATIGGFVAINGLPTIWRSVVTITNSELIANRTNGWGGSIGSQYTNLHSEQTDFTDNYAERVGGAIDASYYSNLYFRRNEYVNNTAGYGGGAVGLYYSNLESYETTWHANEADAAGALRAAWYSSYDIGGDVFSANSANVGGAISNTVSSSGNIYDSFFNHNTADFSGGAIEASSTSTTVAVRFSTFANNYAGYRGGALSVFSEGLFFASTFSGNESPTGATLFLQDGYAELDWVTLANSVGKNAQLRVEGDGAEIHLRHSYLEGSTVCSYEGDVLVEPYSRYNYLTDQSCALPELPTAPGNVIGAPAPLEPLALAGGLTPVHMPSTTANNPIVDAFPSQSCNGLLDQLSQQRAIGNGCDHGAVEAHQATPEPITGKFPNWEPITNPEPVNELPPGTTSTPEQIPPTSPLGTRPTRRSKAD